MDCSRDICCGTRYHDLQLWFTLAVCRTLGRMPHAAALSRRRARTALRKAARMDGPGPQRAKRQSLGGFPPHR